MDDASTINDYNPDTCTVVEIEESESGDLILMERPQEQVFSENRFCVVECKIEPSEDEPRESLAYAPDDVNENIEIIYLPEYDSSINGPIIIKQELGLLHDGDDDFEETDYESYEIINSDHESYVLPEPTISLKDYSRGQKRTFSQREIEPTNGVLSQYTGETRLRSNPNVILKHQGRFHPQDRSWTLKVDAKNFKQTKGISSVTTVYTQPNSIGLREIKTEQLENEVEPENCVTVSDVKTSARTLSSALPHKCKYCDQSFRQSVSLQIHSTLHSQSIPDGCHVS